jgi:hypothetical protein
VQLKTKLYCEVGVKNAFIFFLSSYCFFPWVISSQREMPLRLQGVVVSMMGFLMAAAIIGAFELTYCKMNLAVWYLRYIAHITKFFLYLAITLLIMIANGAMGVSPGFFNDPIAVSSILVLAALFLYDVWDAVQGVSGSDG